MSTTLLGFIAARTLCPINMVEVKFVLWLIVTRCSEHFVVAHKFNCSLLNVRVPGNVSQPDYKLQFSLQTEIK